MKRLMLLGLGIGLVIGCSGKPDLTSVLATGREAIVADWTPDGRPREKSRPAEGELTHVGIIPFGTRVRISQDAGRADDEFRRVSVICLDGPHKDALVRISRYNLKPL